jgi:multiple sugar transport system substrate-binding protein
MVMAVAIVMVLLACTSTPAVTPSPAAQATGTPVAHATGTPVAQPTGTPVAQPTGTPAAQPTGTPVAPPTATAAVTPSPTPEPTPILTFNPIPRGQPGPNGGTVVRWFIGLGAGTQPAQVDPEKKFVEAYNNSQHDVYLQIEIIGNTTAADILKTEIASGNAPDIIGPVGVEGLNLFSDQLLDMAPLIASTGYTPTGVDPALIDFFKSLGQNGATVGLPFAVYPSFIFYNKDLFDEANLPYPPTKVGDQYDGAPWDLAALRTLSMKLTVDSAGNDATSTAFDPTKIVQWGFDSQFMDNYNARAESAFFGSGALLAADGHTAQVPDYIKQGEKWYNAGVWTDHFIPTANQVASDLLLAGSEFGSGNLAIDEGHTWFTCCVTPPAGTTPFKFGFAVNPTVNGTITSPLHADTFSILKTSPVADKAFEALQAMVASGDLLTAYGAMPADQTKQAAWFDSIDAGFPGMDLDWSVAQAMLAYPDIPNHQSWVPDYSSVRSAMQAFGDKYRTTPGLDMDAELAALQTTLQGIFDAATK